MFDVSIVAVTFGFVFVFVFVTELPDKTAAAVLVLATRYPAGYVFTGIAAGFAAHVVLAVSAGSLLGLLPTRWLQVASGVLFLVGAGILLVSKRQATEEHVGQPGDQSFWKVAGAGFMLILVAEFGDLTQIMTASLAARYGAPVSVGIGAVVALWAVAGLGVLGGRTLMKHVPLPLITRVSAGVLAALAAVNLYQAVAD
ncbi:TMEM165/GDT1 family protein [Streptomyces sporangiiformans]|uniref:GDT1 family protein n=1 Tax=Streptomyces sporangiiformans TaxID=2315329 RepID=A0A505DRC4_9ACTN|nr:TMEM165/GDT1 family protein [Streptomyces sporangiiformans]TPQ23856.1 TMEM165/GDT1 family protein [Streptomyces sporangiiformans]